MHIIKNHTGRHELLVSTLFGTTGSKRETVCLTADGGPCRFQFDLTADAARELAAALLTEANKVTA